MGDAEDAQVTVEGEDEILDASIKKDPLFVQQYGWIIVLLVAFGYFIAKKISSRPASSDALKKKIDMNELIRQQEKMAESRRKLQERFETQVSKFVEEQDNKQRLKSQERVEEWDKHLRGGGYHSKHHNKPVEEQQVAGKKTKRFMNNDYNPLIGDVSTSQYRGAPRFEGGG